MCQFCVLLVMGICAAGEAQDMMNGEQFLSLIGPLHGQVRDLSFVFEGEREYVGRMPATEAELDAYEIAYQGSVQIKGSDNMYIKMFERHKKMNRVETRIMSLVNGTAHLGSGDDPRTFAIGRLRGGISALHFACSPLRFHTPPDIAKYKNASEMIFKFLAWTPIDRHSCLQCEIAEPAARGHKVKRYWFDLQRGGHALRTESWIDDQLTDVLKDVQLLHVQANDGSMVWLPVRATREEYTWNGEWQKEPVLLTNFHMLESSIVVNSGIPDAEFDLAKRASRANPRGISPEWVRLAEEARKPKLRTDAPSVKKHLDDLMSEADRQARLVEATRPVSEEWDTMSLVRVGIFSLGILALGFAALRHRGII